MTSSIKNKDMVVNFHMNPIHPGVILFEMFMEPHKLSQNKLARDIFVPPRRINEIIHGKRSITADTALRLAKYFGVAPRFWTSLQNNYELELAEDKIENELNKILSWEEQYGE